MRNSAKGMVLAALLSGSVCTGAYGDVGLVGDACEAGWNRDIPELFDDAGNGMWTWEGFLSGGKEFKFIGNVGTWDAWVPENAGTVVSGSCVHKLNYYTAKNGVADNKFRLAADAYVRITVNVNEHTARFEYPYFYLCGTATRNGWDNANAEPVFGMEWTGMLYGSADEVRDFKILQLRGKWTPCWNAAASNEELTDGDHVIRYNTGNNGVSDHKFRVTASGLYTLKITFSESGDRLSVSRAAAPDLRGAFRANPGLMMVAYDNNASQAWFGRIPQQLYIGTGASGSKELPRIGEGDFEGEVQLEPGRYHLSGNLRDWSAGCFSPVGDVPLNGGSTEAIVPYDNDGGYFVVAQEGRYFIKAHLANASEWGGVLYPGTPSVSGVLEQTDGIDAVGTDADGHNATVSAANGVITVTGHGNAPVAVYNIAGVKLGSTPQTRVAPGVYIVAVGDKLTKIAVK